MTRTHLAFALIGLLALGLWGCNGSDRVSQMEARVAKLEEDLKATTTARDALRTRLVALEEQVRAESERAKLLELERDTLVAKLRDKAAEKETVVTQYDELVKKLEAVIGQAKVTQSKQADGKVQGTVTSYQK